MYCALEYVLDKTDVVFDQSVVYWFVIQNSQK